MDNVTVSEYLKVLNNQNKFHPIPIFKKQVINKPYTHELNRPILDLIQITFLTTFLN